MSDKNVVSIEDRIPKLKQARKKKANRRLIFYLSIFFFLISIIVYLQSPLSHIKAIDVKGNLMVPEEEIVDLSGLTNETSIWSIDKKEISENIQANPMVDTAEVKRKLPHGLVIIVNEHALVGFMKDNSYYYPIIENGSVLKDLEQNKISGEAPLLINFTDDEYFRKMATELNELPKSILNVISEVHWEPTEENKNKIMLYMNDGYLVSSTIRNFADKMTVYPSIVSQLDSEDKGIIHIGVGAYFESFEK